MNAGKQVDDYARRLRLTLFTLVILAVPCFAGEITLEHQGAQAAAVGLPGGQVRLSLVKGWGRTAEPKTDGTAWKAEGGKLPAVVFQSGDGWWKRASP